MIDNKLFVIYKNLGSVLEILLIFSKKDSKGAGKQLLDHLINAHGQVDGIWLEVHEDNQKAIQFYERLGFQRVSVRRGYYPEDKQAFNYNLTIDRKSK